MMWQEQEFVHVSNRRLLLPRLYNIDHPAPSPAPAPVSYAPLPPTANYAEPASPAPSPAREDSNAAPPAPPSSIKFDTTSFEEPNRGTYTTSHHHVQFTFIGTKRYWIHGNPVTHRIPVGWSDASVTVNCGDRLCARIWIGSKRVLVMKYE